MTNKVFVYGSLKRGFGNHRVIGSQTFIGEAETLDDTWAMFSMGGFPAVLRGENKIAGEVYEVDAAGMQSLDWLEGNGHFYNREIIGTTEGDAWIYVLMGDADRVRDSKDRVENNEGVETWVV